MKKVFMFILLFMMMTMFSKAALKTTLLNISGSAIDICSDNNNVVHVVWKKKDGLYYGVLNGKVVSNIKKIPHTGGAIKTNYTRPRIGVKPDGTEVHITFTNSQPDFTLEHVWRTQDGQWHYDVPYRRINGMAIAVTDQACDLSGTVHIIGEAYRPGHGPFFNKIIYLYKRPNSSWRWYSLVESSSKVRDTDMFCDRNGGVHATWKGAGTPGFYRYCPSGRLLKDSNTEIMPKPNGVRTVSFGDLFVDHEMNVHHTYFAYKNHNVWYGAKMKGESAFGHNHPLSGRLALCHSHDYENPWPAIGVSVTGKIYVAWAEMPCPSSVANAIFLMTKDPNSKKWSEKCLSRTANLSPDFKPVIAVTDTGVFIIWRENAGKTFKMAWEGNLSDGGGAVLSPISFISHADGDRVCGVEEIEVKGNYREGSDSLSSLKLFIDDKEVASGTEKLTYAWDSNSVNAGEHTIIAKGITIVGKKVEEKIIVEKNCPPDVNIISPINNSSVNGIETIEVQASDDSNLKSVKVYIDGKLKFSSPVHKKNNLECYKRYYRNKFYYDNLPEIENEVFRYEWDTEPYKEYSKHTITVKAVDSSGLVSSKSSIVKVIKLYPPISLVGQTLENRSVFYVEYFNKLTWEANPDNAGKQIVRYEIFDNMGRLMKACKPEEREFCHRNIKAGKEYTYVINTVINEGGQEIKSKSKVLVMKGK